MGQSAYLFIFLLHYGLENKVDYITKNEMDNWMLGATDKQQAFYNSLDAHDKSLMLDKINRVLKIFFHKEEQYD